MKKTRKVLFAIALISFLSGLTVISGCSYYWGSQYERDGHYGIFDPF